jgi:type II secretory ATPase GspE/PulE/Tfp pilus assembly ATPase PilB-like protein
MAFLIGLAFWLIPGVGTLMAYVVHRNGRVIPTARVLTPGHLQRIIDSVRGEKKAKVDKGIRVRLLDAQGEGVDKPSDPEELTQFDVVQEFLFDVLWKRASDADVKIGGENVRVAYKIDGVVSEQPEILSHEEAEQAMTYLKRIAGLNIDERRRPQKGRIRAGLLGQPGKPENLDVQTSGSTSGERLRLRVQQTAALLKLENLGFAPHRLSAFRKIVEKDTGLVLFAGPAESGLTTTQYATLRAHDAYLQNIYTVEDTPLIQIDNITQQTFGAQQPDASFARTVQTVLRREPDIVMVCRCDDRETAELVCRAGVEKKMYVAIQAASSFDAIGRLLALTDNPKLVASSLAATVAQRLLRILCPACREAYKPDEQLLRKANLPVDKIEHFHRPPSAPIVDKKGREIICQTCQGSRYVGRTGVFELFVVSDATRKLIAAGAPLKQIKSQARKEKMLYLQEEGLLKVMEGVTSMAEVMRGLRVNGK